jgi:hypothetical protein
MMGNSHWESCDDISPATNWRDFCKTHKSAKMDADVNPPPEGPANNKKRKDLTHEQRREIVRHLLLEVKEGAENFELRRGAQKDVAGRFGVVPTTVMRIWDRARLSLGDDALGDFQASPLRKGRCGRPQI